MFLVGLRAVILQCTDVYVHCSKYITSDAVNCDISTQCGGVGGAGCWSWFLGIPHTKPFLELFVKGEGGETFSWQSVCPEESWRVRQC